MSTIILATTKADRKHQTCEGNRARQAKEQKVRGYGTLKGQSFSQTVVTSRGIQTLSNGLCHLFKSNLSGVVVLLRPSEPERINHECVIDKEKTFTTGKLGLKEFYPIDLRVDVYYMCVSSFC